MTEVKTKTKAKKKKGKWLIIVAVILVILTGIGFLGYKTLKIAKLDVKGNSIVSTEVILGLADIQIGESLLSVSNSKVEANIEKNPYLIFDSINRVFPDTIIINVKERTPKAIIQYVGSTVIIDANGYVLAVADNNTNNAIPVLKGVAVKTATVGSTLEPDNKYQLNQVKEIIAGLEKEEVYGIITEINMTDPNSIVLTTNDGYTVKLGEFENIQYKIRFFKTTRDQIIQMGKSGGTIDVTTGDKAYYEPSSSTQ